MSSRKLLQVISKLISNLPFVNINQLMSKQKHLLKKLLKENVLYKALALFFVMFTFLDIVLFGYCCEELPFADNCLSEVTENSSIEIPQTVENKIFASITLEQEHTEDKQTPCSTDKDCCFCCCAHWVLTNKLYLDKTETVLPMQAPDKIYLPESPPRKTYRPPRAI